MLIALVTIDISKNNILLIYVCSLNCTQLPRSRKALRMSCKNLLCHNPMTKNFITDEINILMRYLQLA